MTQFYLTLPSNTTSDLKNTPSKFNVHLPQKINLIGDYECGLSEIIYPHNFETIKEHETDIKIILEEGDTVIVKIPTGCYDSVENLLETINYCLQKDDLRIGEVGFLYNAAIKRVMMKVKKGFIKSVTLPISLSEKLGFFSHFFEKTTMGEREPVLSRDGFDLFYIYLNILEPQIVGDVAAPLLRIVNVEGKYPAIINRTFDFPHYMNVLVKDFSDIEVNIKDDSNNFVDFLSGKVIIKLHFRKIIKPYF